MLDRLEAIQARFDQLGVALTNPEIVGNNQKFTATSKEYRNLEKIVVAYRSYRKTLDDIALYKEALVGEDAELRELAKMELPGLEEMRSTQEAQIRQLLIPKDPQDDKNAILEIRAGTGGDEAGLFAGELLRAYLRFAEEKGWNTEMLSLTEGSVGGIKEASVQIRGEQVYGILKFESGVHRVQRVPATESQGRVHTSAATVAVLPEADELDVQIRDVDIRKDTFRSSGAGGQHVNKTESGVRLTHFPTGIVVECQDGRSQHQNYDRALTVLRARIWDKARAERDAAVAEHRKSLVSTGDRSAKIRTYNFPQSRVTDHRIGLTVYNLPDVMNGDLKTLIEGLRVADHAERLKQGADE